MIERNPQVRLRSKRKRNMLFITEFETGKFERKEFLVFRFCSLQSELGYPENNPLEIIIH